MILLAMGTGNPVWGATIMFAFILGTSPIFFLIGLAASELFRKKAFVYLAAGFIAVMGILAINSGQLLRGSIHTLQNYWKILVETPEDIRSAKIVSGVQEVTIKVIDRGYEANINSLKVGVPVKLKLVTNGVRSCAGLLEIDLEEAGIKAKCSYKKNSLEVEFDDKLNESEVFSLVIKSGYQIDK